MSTQLRESMSKAEQILYDNCIIQLNNLFKMEQYTNQVSPEQLAAQQAYKVAKDTLKSFIKHRSLEQKETKVLRKRDKTNNTSYCSTAQLKHAINRNDLRHLYLAYAIIRHKYGGYTKLRAMYPMPEGIFNIGELNIPGINNKYLQTLYENHAPKTIHINP